MDESGPAGLSEVISNARVAVCVGPGGVGKTSTAAAIALRAARMGRRAIVLTIDPARRLASALGLPEIGNEERVVTEDAFHASGLEVPAGRLTAMMLDIKDTWDEVVSRYHPDPERKAKLMSNRLYLALSTALAGSQEYMAMEKLHLLAHRESDPLDLIVLDTPPATNAVDFLEAPSKVLNALDNDATRWLLEPYTSRGRLAQRLFDAGSSFFIRTISRFTGAELLQELAELLACFQDMFDGFRERARAVRTLLADEQTTFLVISTPSPCAFEDAQKFTALLEEREINVGAMILNRATVDPFRGGSEPDPSVLSQAVLGAGGEPDLSERLRHLAALARETAGAERRAAERIRADGRRVLLAPELAGDIHDLASLEVLGRHLFAGDRNPIYPTTSIG